MARALLTRTVQSGAICTMAKPPSPNVRLTISVTSEVHATFQRLSEVSGQSISKSMGEWLADTLEGATFMAHTLEKARAAPKQLVQELAAMNLGLGDDLAAMMARIRDRERKATGLGMAEPSTYPVATPRSVIRGGKSRTGNTKELHPKGQDHDE